MSRESVCPGGCVPPKHVTWETTRYGRQADSTHPTGILSCYRPKRSFGQGNIFTPVCHSVHGGGGWGVVPDQHNPPSWDQTPPRDQTPPGPDPPEPDPPPGTADSGIRSTIGRYASYWNAFSFTLFLDNLRTQISSLPKLFGNVISAMSRYQTILLMLFIFIFDYLLQLFCCHTFTMDTASLSLFLKNTTE